MKQMNDGKIKQGPITSNHRSSLMANPGANPLGQINSQFQPMSEAHNYCQTTQNQSLSTTIDNNAVSMAESMPRHNATQGPHGLNKLTNRTLGHRYSNCAATAQTNAG